MDPLDPKNPPIVYGRCVVVIEDSYKSKGNYVLRCLTKSQRGLTEVVFDDQVDDMIVALKKAQRSIFWRRFRRIILGG
jgi:hypothetical protein